MDTIATEIKIGDKIKVYRGYCNVIDIKERGSNILFKYISIENIENWIQYRKTTKVKVY